MKKALKALAVLLAVCVLGAATMLALMEYLEHFGAPLSPSADLLGPRQDGGEDTAAEATLGSEVIDGGTTPERSAQP